MNRSRETGLTRWQSLRKVMRHVWFAQLWQLAERLLNLTSCCSIQLRQQLSV